MSPPYRLPALAFLICWYIICLGLPKGPTRRVEPHSLGSGLDHMNDEADGLSGPGQEGVYRRGKELSAPFAPANRPLAMVSGHAESVSHHDPGPTAGTGGRKQFHDGSLLEANEVKSKETTWNGFCGGAHYLRRLILAESMSWK